MTSPTSVVRPGPIRRWPVVITLLIHVGCQEDCSGLPSFSIPDCRYEGLAWSLGSLGSPTFTKVEDLTDPAASPLVGKLRVGQVVLLGPVLPVEVCTQTHAPTVSWTSSAPQIATIQATGTLSGSLTALSEGEAAIFATIDGSRTQMQFRCCAPSCVSPPPLPNCQDIPVPMIRVVPGFTSASETVAREEARITRSLVTAPRVSGPAPGRPRLR